MFPQPAASGKYTIYLRITHAGRHRYRTLNRHVNQDQWNAETCRFTKTFPNWKTENEIMTMYEARAASILRDFERDSIPFSFDTFEAEMFASQSATSKAAPGLVEYTRRISDELKRENRHGNSLLYHNLAHLFELYRPRTTLGEINVAWLTRFEHYQRAERGMKAGGIAANMRTLRAICNRAIKAGIMRQDWYPFRDYSLKHLNQPTPKRAIPISDIQRFIDAPVENDKERLARDLFIFSLYTRGMNLVDIAHLKPQNIQSGRIEYTRRKTHTGYSIALNEITLALLERYAIPGAQYLFPILSEFHVTEKQQQERIHRVMVDINQSLRTIAGRLSIPGYISFYTARHTYASALKERGVSTDVISEALGHSNLKTTEIYLKQFDRSVIDKADALLIIAPPNGQITDPPTAPQSGELNTAHIEHAKTGT